MNSFSDRLLKKREVLLRSIDLTGSTKPNGTERPLKNTPDTAPNCGSEYSSDGLSSVVHYWLKLLLRRGLTFQQILLESGVSRTFLEQAFRELDLDPLKDQILGEPVVSTEDARKSTIEDKSSRFYAKDTKLAPASHVASPLDDKKPKSIESEIRLFMFRTILDANRLTAFLRQPGIAEQLKDEKNRQDILNHGHKITHSLQKLFQNVETAGKAQTIETATGSQSSKRSLADSDTEMPSKKAKVEKDRSESPNEPSSSSSSTSRNSSPAVCNNNPQLTKRTTNKPPNGMHKPLPPRTEGQCIESKQPAAQKFTPYKSLISSHLHSVR